MSKIRNASHAGSWYSERGNVLDGELTSWLNSAQITQQAAQAIIAPHAGYAHSGETAAFAYKHIDPNPIERVFIFGPSHHVSLSGCALSQADIYSTPLYNLNIDKNVVNELKEMGMFELISPEADEDEHSIEMHLPYIAKVMASKKNDFTIVPVIVGSLSFDLERQYGKLFSKYLAQPQNLFVISSDFCHWGQRFKFTYHNTDDGEIWKSIENLDRIGMNLIEKQDHSGFNNYLKKFHNTICGRHPIGLLLAALDVLRPSMGSSCKFVRYAQSSRCHNMRDSSVSYASAIINLHH